MIAVLVGVGRHQARRLRFGFFRGQTEAAGTAALERILAHHRTDLGEGLDHFGMIAEAGGVQMLDEPLPAEMLNGARGDGDLGIVAGAEFAAQRTLGVGAPGVVRLRARLKFTEAMRADRLDELVNLRGRRTEAMTARQPPLPRLLNPVVQPPPPPPPVSVKASVNC